VLSYDLVVCGAGPAGAMAAATAARAGLKVALLEKYPLPRHKTCGGGTPMVMQNFLYDLAPEAFVEADTQFMRHTWNFTEPVMGAINPDAHDRPLSLWMVQRSVFDHALVQQAARAGAEVRDSLAVRSLVVEGDRVRVRAQVSKGNETTTKGTEFEALARYVIGADGANGVTAKAANLRQNPAIAIGMELELPHRWGAGHPDLRPEVLHLDFGAVPGGYAWVFPKADHLNVGAGVFNPDRFGGRGDRSLRLKLRQTILNYLESLHLPSPPEDLKFHAHPLPIWHGKEPLHSPDGKILLAGDAAGLINPFFGDGILYAVKSGRTAAQAVIDGATLEYSDRIHAQFAANFDAALTMANFFYQYPGFCYRYGVSNPRATRAAARLIAGELPFNHLASHIFKRLRGRLVEKLSGAGRSLPA
jgi:geranylgeranyl reductase family protein